MSDENDAPTCLRRMFSSVARGKHVMRRWVLVAVLTATIGVFLYELFLLLPYVNRFVPTDYEVMRQWGRATQNGDYSSYYPLPASLWIFIPLSLLPSWFVFVWTTIPFVLILYLFQKKGIVLWLFVPTLVQAAWGQLDGYLILPLYWLFQDHPAPAGISAAILTLKPQFAILPVLYILLRWFRTKNARALHWFGVAMFLLYIPAFFIEPFWVLTMIAGMQERAGLWFLPQRSSTLWGWWWQGDGAVWALPILIGLILVLLVRAWQDERKRAQAMHLLNLLIQPVSSHYANCLAG